MEHWLGLKYETNSNHALRGSCYSDGCIHNYLSPKHGCSVDVYRSWNIDDNWDCDFTN